MSIFGPPLLLIAAVIALTGGHAVGGDIERMEEAWAAHETAA